MSGDKKVTLSSVFRAQGEEDLARLADMLAVTICPSSMTPDQRKNIYGVPHDRIKDEDTK